MTKLLARHLQWEDCLSNHYLSVIKRTIDLFTKRRYLAAEIKSSKAKVICQTVIDHLGHEMTAKAMFDTAEETEQTFNQLESLLVISVISNNIHLLHDVVRQSLNVNKEYEYFGLPLQLAASQGHFEIVKALLESGANPNLCSNNRTIFCHSPDAPKRHGINPLHSACVKKHEPIIQILVDPKYHLDPFGPVYESAIEHVVLNQQIQLVEFFYRKMEMLRSNISLLSTYVDSGWYRK